MPPSNRRRVGSVASPIIPPVVFDEWDAHADPPVEIPQPAVDEVVQEAVRRPWRVGPNELGSMTPEQRIQYARARRDASARNELLRRERQVPIHFEQNERQLQQNRERIQQDRERVFRENANRAYESQRQARRDEFLSQLSPAGMELFRSITDRGRQQIIENISPAEVNEEAVLRIEQNNIVRLENARARPEDVRRQQWYIAQIRAATESVETDIDVDSNEESYTTYKIPPGWWKMRNGRFVLIIDMTDSHLEKTILMLQRKLSDLNTVRANTTLAEEWSRCLPELIAEKERRRPENVPARRIRR